MNTRHCIISSRARLAVDVSGDGEPVVFLHAAVCDRRMWRAQMDGLSTTHRAIAYDRRGFGETQADQEDHSSVSDLMAVLDTLANGKSAILVACSQGGRIAIDAALAHPSRVKGLVLIAPSVRGAPAPVYPPEINALLALQTEAEQTGDFDRASAIKARLWLDGPFQAEGRITGEARRLFLDMSAISLQAPPVGADVDGIPAYHRLREIAAPTLVIWGDLDFPNIRDRCGHMVTTMPNAVGHVLAGAAHLPSLERPAEITQLIVEFVRRCS
jgi:pimeloyl-ACP methyl ester carboxylesterase